MLFYVTMYKGSKQKYRNVFGFFSSQPAAQDIGGGGGGKQDLIVNNVQPLMFPENKCTAVAKKSFQWI
jgi:hypothetical protein